MKRIRKHKEDRYIMAANNTWEMGSSSQSAAQRVKREADLISYLPKELCCQILSFLPTKDAVQTCVLSKRWQSLWKYICHVEFDEAHYYTDEEEHEEDPVIKFTNYVNTFFHLYEGKKIETFRLSCSGYCDIANVSTWIRVAIKCRVQELELNIESEDPLALPHSLFMCHSLTVLKLHFHGCPLLLPTSVVDLPQLKTLHLRSIKFVNNNLSHQLLSNCPNLENLNLENCEYDIGGIFDISVPSLKSLVLIGFPWFDLRETALDCKIKIVAPQLVSLVSNGLIAPQYHIENMPLLFDASLHIKNSAPNEWNMASSVVTIFRAISSVQLLHLSDLIITLLSSEQYLSNNLPIFRNLNHLSISSRFHGNQLQGITRLLQHIPDLEYLELDIIQVPNNNTERLLLDELNIDFLTHRLKVVEIKNISLHNNYFEFVKHVIASAEVLERITIEIQGIDWFIRWLLNRILRRLPRVSTDCVIEVRRL